MKKIFIALAVAISASANAAYDNPADVANTLKELVPLKSEREKAIEIVESFEQEANKNIWVPKNKKALPTKDTIVGYKTVVKDINNSDEDFLALVLVKPNGNCVISLSGTYRREAVPVVNRAASEVLSYPCENTLVRLNSIGGQIAFGFYLGFVIKRFNWDTIAWNKDTADKTNPYNACNSACALAFMAGKNRYILPEAKIKNTSNEYGFIGIHKSYELKNNEKVCENKISDRSNLLTYEYARKTNPKLALPFLMRLMQTTCTNFMYFDSYTNDGEFMRMFYNKTFDDKTNAEYSAVSPVGLKAEGSKSNSASCVAACKQKAQQCSQPQKQVGFDTVLECMDEEHKCLKSCRQ